MVNENIEKISIVNEKFDSSSPEKLNAAIEQYKITRSATLDLINDRNANTRFLLGIVSAILAFQVYLLKAALVKNGVKINFDMSAIGTEIVIALIISSVCGLVFSIIWLKISKNFGLGLKARYTLLKKIEDELPFAPFKFESDIRTELKYKPISSYLTYKSAFFITGFTVTLVICLLRLVDK